MELFPYFAYGTTQQGFPHHRRLADLLGEPAGRVRTVAPHAVVVPRHAACSNPGCRLVHRMAVLVPGVAPLRAEGDLFLVPGETIAALDRMETGSGGPYVRATVEVAAADGAEIQTAQAYVAREPARWRALAERGDAEALAAYPRGLAAGERLKEALRARSGTCGTARRRGSARGRQVKRLTNARAVRVAQHGPARAQRRDGAGAARRGTAPGRWRRRRRSTRAGQDLGEQAAEGVPDDRRLAVEPAYHRLEVVGDPGRYRRHIMRRHLVAVLLGVACLAGCGGGDDGLSVIPEASLDYALPGDTLAEWVEHGDQLSVLAVTGETRPAAWPAYRDSGGLVGRTVTVRVERTLWHRAGAPRANGVLRLEVWGWMYDDDQDPRSARAALVAEGATRMRVGKRYLAVLVRRRGVWALLRDSAVMTLSRDGRVTSEVYEGEPSAGARSLRGRTLAEAAGLVAAASRAHASP